ncbi:MAG: fumarylacetoacetate hydrolase family protein, partial [Pseudomonadales bacterium]
KLADKGWLDKREVRQDGTTDQLIFSITFLIAYLSRVTTLSSGDLIFTGTPEGIGAPQGKFLADGDVVTTRIEGLGVLENHCVRVADHGVC